MKKMQVNITVEYNNVEDPNGPEAEEIIQNLKYLHQENLDILNHQKKI